MKKWFFFLIVLGWSVFSSQLFAQGPPPPPGDPSTGGGPVGGSAPIGEGFAFFMVFSAAYAARKYSKMKDKTKEE